MSLFYAPVTSTPTAACPVNRFPTSLSQRSHKTLVLAAPVSINDASSVLHFRSASQNTTDSIMYRLFLIRSIPWLLTTAPMGVLQPAPVCRLRKAFFHLTKSISAPLMKSSGIQDALCAKLLLLLIRSNLLCSLMWLTNHHYCNKGAHCNTTLKLSQPPA